MGTKISFKFSDARVESIAVVRAVGWAVATLSPQQQGRLLMIGSFVLIAQSSIHRFL
jgi:hypothetical protein